MRNFWAALSFLAGLQAAACQSFATVRETPAQMLFRADSLYSLHQWAEAKDAYAGYLRDSSESKMALTRLGFCNQNLGLLDEAIHNYEQVLSGAISPLLRGTVSFRMACILAHRQKKEEALDWLTRAANAGFINLQEMDTSRDLLSIKEDPKFKELHQKIIATAFPCSLNPRTKDFDFWLGEWEVFQTGTRFKVGESNVQSISGGCAILENWVSISGIPGKSINYYNTVTGKWEQDWMGSDGSAQRYIDGEYMDSALRFTYETFQNGQKSIGHFIFYNQGKNHVRQFQDVSTDEGKTFSVSYDFTYIRKH